MQPQKVFAIPFGVQGITMMIGAAAGVIKRVTPAEQAKDIEKFLLSALVRDTVPWPNSCGTVPVKKLPMVPCTNSATAKASQLAYAQNTNTRAPVTENRQMSTDLPPAFKATSMT